MAGRIRHSDIDEVKSRTNIADVISDYVTLKPAGVGSVKGLCPFHDERSPSFNVRPQAGFYHCFGCGEGGDVYTFVQRMDHLTFSETVERLAARIGYTLHYEDGQASPERSSRARALAANRSAEQYFQRCLAHPRADIARQFLAERGFDAAAAQHFGLGYAPPGWDNVIRHLRQEGFTAEEMTEAGLISQGRRGSYDRFRNRVIWPIRDVTGQTVGFGARRLADDDTGPKYLNTPETTVYHKSQVLYGLDLAKRDISRQKQAVVVEGYTDVMACHLAGITTAVATCGTAFGPEHVAVLRRILGDDSTAGEVIFTFDPDSAGQKAAMRAFSQEKRFAAQTSVAIGPDGLDPCDLRLSRGDEAVRSMFEARRPLFEFVLEQLVSQHDLDTVEGRVSALRQAAPVVAGIRDRGVREGYTRVLARQLGVDAADVARELRRAGSAHGDASRPEADNAVRTAASGAAEDASSGRAGQELPVTFDQLGRGPVMRLERDALAAVLQHPQLVGRTRAEQVLRSGVHDQALAVVRDAMVAASDSLESHDWLHRVLEQAGERFAPIVRLVAVAALPARDEEAMASYVRGVTASLVDRNLLDEKSQLLGRLQRSDTDGEDYRRLQQSLVTVETQRRRLRED